MRNKRPNWTLQVILDEKTNYDRASKFMDRLAMEIKRRLEAKGISGIVIAKTEYAKKALEDK